LKIDTGGRRIVEYPRVNVKPQVMFWRMMFETAWSSGQPSFPIIL
jgi:hypothetical protein